MRTPEKDSHIIAQNILQKIKRRPVIVLGSGPSAGALKDNIYLFRNKDVLWMGLNYFWWFDEILASIGKKIEIAYYAPYPTGDCAERINTYIETGSVLITSTQTKIQLKTEKNNVISSDWGYGFNSIFAILITLGMMGVKDIYLIGFDGGISDGQNIYFNNKRPYEQDGMNIKSYAELLLRETNLFNDVFPIFYKFNRIKTNIKNLNGSRINCFPYLTIKEIAEEIK